GTVGRGQRPARRDHRPDRLTVARIFRVRAICRMLANRSRATPEIKSMTAHPTFKPFNFQDWIARNKGSLKPPVANKQLFDHKTGMTVMIVGGPNRRVDFHDDP